ncbi:hypothetical protein ACFVP3_29390 [Streptomyces sp. NPDC057806]|uniref:hypothetical protein n=1 Tax=Streptomyces sp. NPDC057806 TaxID=3346255 RepID=UPI0036C092E2
MSDTSSAVPALICAVASISLLVGAIAFQLSRADGKGPALSVFPGGGGIVASVVTCGVVIDALGLPVAPDVASVLRVTAALAFSTLVAVGAYSAGRAGGLTWPKCTFAAGGGFTGSMAIIAVALHAAGLS